MTLPVIPSLAYRTRSKGGLTWLTSNPAFSVTPRSATIGRMELPAFFVDIGIAPGATDEDPYCEKHLHTNRVALLSWPNSGENIYSWAAPGLIRLYLADVTYDGKRHLLTVAVEGHDAADLKAFLPAAKAVIRERRSADRSGLIQLRSATPGERGHGARQPGN